MKSRLFRLTTEQKALRTAWRKVYANGIASRAVETQEEVKAFASDTDRSIRRIQKDLRADRFANLHIAQTSVARTTTIVIRQDLGASVAFHLVFDSASAEYMWLCLDDAMAEFDGRFVGLAAVRKLLES